MQGASDHPQGILAAAAITLLLGILAGLLAVTVWPAQAVDIEREQADGPDSCITPMATPVPLFTPRPVRYQAPPPYQSCLRARAAGSEPKDKADANMPLERRLSIGTAKAMLCCSEFHLHSQGQAYQVAVGCLVAVATHHVIVCHHVQTPSRRCTCRLSRLGVTGMPTSPRTAAPEQATAAMSMPATTPLPARSTARAARTAPVSTSALSCIPVDVLSSTLS